MVAAQYEIQVAFYLYQGNWWLYVKGTDAQHAIGYYPTSIYKNGAMASHATELDYGGEVVGTSSFPGMGSGHFANQGLDQSLLSAGHLLLPDRWRRSVREPHSIAELAKLLYRAEGKLRSTVERHDLLWRSRRKLLITQTSQGAEAAATWSPLFYFTRFVCFRIFN